MKLRDFLLGAFAVLFSAACERKRAASDAAPAYQFSPDRGKAEQVVVVVWDGMRPDLVSAENTPNLWALAQRGVFFANHHPAFPSTTEVNGAALATGLIPAHGGIIGNTEFRPALDPRKGVHTEDLAVVRKSDALTHGRHLGGATVAETVPLAGFRTAVAGTKPVALLQDRAEARTASAARSSAAVFAGQSVPAEALAALRAARGKFPSKVTFPNTAQDRWTTETLTAELWQPGVPKYSVLWLSDPDFSQHAHSPGAPGALAALHSADDMLGIVAATLKSKGVLQKTDLFVVSDHGFSTVGAVADLAQVLAADGVSAHRSFSSAPQVGEVLIVSTGATALLYVTGHDAAATAKVVRALQAAPSTGVIFTRATAEGTFPLSAAGIDSTDAPDVVAAPRWSAENNPFGVPGTLIYDGGKKPGAGMHGSLSPFDQTNTLIAAGPDFRSGMRSALPSGNLDVAPTVLWLLGIRPLAALDGRVLFEAIRDRPANPALPEEKRLEAARDLGAIRWTQFLRTVTFDRVTYFLEGNGSQEKK